MIIGPIEITWISSSKSKNKETLVKYWYKYFKRHSKEEYFVIKIQTIKKVREVLGCTLREAKEIFDTNIEKRTLA